MKGSELIERLTELIEAEGDMKVICEGEEDGLEVEEVYVLKDENSNPLIIVS